MERLKHNDLTHSITEAINRYRKERGIIPTPNFKFEPSCFAYGNDIHNLVFCQLIPTTNGTGEWPALADPELARAVYQYIQTNLPPDS